MVKCAGVFSGVGNRALVLLQCRPLTFDDITEPTDGASFARGQERVNQELKRTRQALLDASLLFSLNQAERPPCPKLLRA